MKKLKKRMKKLFFLFAVSAMFAACSSDDQTEIVNGGGNTDTPTEMYVSSGSVSFENGTGMSIGVLDESGNPATRAESALNFTIDLKQLQDDILSKYENYILKADDFAIRVDGDWQDIDVESTTSGNRASLDNIMIETAKGEKLLVAVNNLQNLVFNEVKDELGNVTGYTPNDYTFEAYIWIENKALLNDGTGGYGELFTDQDKFDWIGFDNEQAQILYYKDLPIDTETGQDWSESIFNEGNSVKFSAEEPKLGLTVRYNVYRGLQGRNGDTPYIKVSVSVTKEAPTTIGGKDNQFTFVDYKSENPK